MLSAVTLDVVMLNIIFLCVVMLNVVMLNVVMLNVVMLNVVAECCYAECCYAGCRGALTKGFFHFYIMLLLCKVTRAFAHKAEIFFVNFIARLFNVDKRHNFNCHKLHTVLRKLLNAESGCAPIMHSLCFIVKLCKDHYYL